MSRYDARALRSRLALLLAPMAFAAALAIGGCADEMPPVGPEDPKDDVAYRVLFTEVSDPDDWSRDSRLISIRRDGSGREELAPGFLVAPPTSAYVLLVDASYDVWRGTLAQTGPIARVKLFNASSLGFPDARVDGSTIAMAPMGAWVTYTTRNGQRDARTVITDGVGTVELPIAVSYETSPAFSPDGNRLAFYSHDSNWVDGLPEGKLYVVNVDGTGLRALATIEDIAHDDVGSIEWSPQGDRIAFNTDGPNDGAMRVIDLDGNQILSIPSAGFGSFSPDGDSIVYTRYDVGADLYIASARGSGPQRGITLTAGSAEVYARYSPDGRHIAYSSFVGHFNESAEKIVVVELATGKSDTLSTKGHRPYWIP